ncbi:biotin--[acetyl-CoA-carboxylase] ligase [Acetobacter orientalis]|uniref:biotin--[acetyl-CoA-carboxylase] ligase n=1 Tax=Acetobacter orientalis TaxID=146474 RepID=UPI0039EAE4E4
MKAVCPPWRFECYNELTSTSDICMERVQAGAAPGLAILALSQTKGRGSRGRTWVDAGQSLALSMVLDAGCTGQKALGCWPFVASLAFYEGLAQAVPAAKNALSIKWPNDILLAGQKLGGILIERTGSALIIGMGANLRAPPDMQTIGRQAAALADYGATTPEDVARAIMAQMSDWCAFLAVNGFEVLCNEWLARAHPVGSPLVVKGGTTYEQGLFAGLAPDGRLLLETKDGIKMIATGDILLASQGVGSASGH